jgi:hypothetical protein
MDRYMNVRLVTYIDGWVARGIEDRMDNDVHIWMTIETFMGDT